MEDTTYKHEQEMKKAGFEDLQNDAETALNNTLDALKKNTDFQQAVIGQMLDTTKANYDEAYNHLNEVIKQHGVVVTETYKEMVGAVADFNDKAVQFTPPDSSVSNQDTSHVETGHNGSNEKVDEVIGSDSSYTTMLQDVQKWYSKLQDWEGPPPKGASGLATYIMKKGKIANRYEFQELADILGIPTPGPENYDEWGVGKLDIKNKMLKKLKEIGFSKGGIVRNFIPVDMASILGKAVVSNNDHGLISARAGETVLTEEFTKMLKPSVETMQKFIGIPNNFPSSISNSGNVTNKIDIYVDKIASDLDINTLAETVANKISRNTKIEMKKLR